jgi:prophage tail gpP-like protein
MMTVRLDGQDFTAWTSVEVSANMKDATRSFSAEIVEADLGGMSFGAYWAPPGTPVQVFADNGEQLLDGFVNEYDPSFTDTDHSIKISGRTESQDAVDSSADHPTGHFKNKDALEISNELAGPVGAVYSCDESLPKIPQFQINQGERVHQVARRLAATYGYACMSTGGKEIKWVKAGETVIGEICEGQYPLLSASASMKDTNLFSNHKNKSQLSSYEDKYGAEAAHNVAEVSDSRVKRHRPKVHVVDKSADKETSQKKAEWSAKQAGADALTVDAEIWGHTINGTLVVPNVRLLVQSPFLKVFRTMLVEGVNWSCSVSDGTKCKFNLVLPSAYDGEDGASQSDTSDSTKSEQTPTSATNSTTDQSPGKAQDDVYQTSDIKSVTNQPVRLQEDRLTRAKPGDLSQ